MSAPEPETRAALERLVRRCLGAEVERCRPVVPGLATRRFFRLELTGAEGPGSVIARVDAAEDPRRRPAGVAPEPPLEPIRRFLAESGIPVPARYGHDPEAGIELLEDVGETTLEAAVATADPSRRRALYTAVARWVPRFQALAAPPGGLAAFERRLDDTLIAYKAERLVEWGLPGLLGRPATAGESKAVREGFARIAAAVRDAPGRLAHRDLKAANVHLRSGAAADRGEPDLVFIDLQGAFLAPPEYDLVCLLHDAHVDLSVPEIDAVLAAIRPELPDAPSPDEFTRRFHLLSLARVGKDVSVYLYAAHGRGDDRYLAFVPNAVRILRRSAARAARLEPGIGALTDLLGSLEAPACGR